MLHRRGSPSHFLSCHLSRRRSSLAISASAVDRSASDVAWLSRDSSSATSTAMVLLSDDSSSVESVCDAGNDKRESAKKHNGSSGCGIQRVRNVSATFASPTATHHPALDPLCWRPCRDLKPSASLVPNSAAVCSRPCVRLLRTWAGRRLL